MNQAFDEVEVGLELLNLLEASSLEAVRRFRDEVVAGRIDGSTYQAAIWRSDGESTGYTRGCPVGKLAEANDLSWGQLLRRAGYYPSNQLRLERAACDIRVGDTPANNTVLAWILNEIDEYLKAQ